MAVPGDLAERLFVKIDYCDPVAIAFEVQCVPPTASLNLPLHEDFHDQSLMQDQFSVLLQAIQKKLTPVSVH